MKATIEIDATPQEMRVLLGLPEVQTLQKEIMEKIRERMLDAIDTNDLDELMKLYMPKRSTFRLLRECKRPCGMR